MSRMQDPNTPDGVTCESCKEYTDDWTEIEISNISDDSDDDPSNLSFCEPCLQILSLYLGIDLNETTEGFVRVNELGQVQAFNKDCN